MKNTGLIIALGVIAVLVLTLFGGVGMMGFGGFGMMGGYGPFGGMTLAPHCVGCSAGVGGYAAQGFGFNLFSGLLSLVFWALIIGGVVLLVVWFVRGSLIAQPANRASLLAPSAEGPLEILKARYARGEITKEQFDTIRLDLEA